MKRLSKIKGYSDSKIKRFNEMYAKLIDGKEENTDELLLYTRDEIEEFRAYVILSEADVKARQEAMRSKRTIADFSQEDIARFDHMQEILAEVNRLLQVDGIDIDLIMPDYSDIEMIENSQYREIWLAHQCKE
jgi:hypothetical protein